MPQTGVMSKVAAVVFTALELTYLYLMKGCVEICRPETIVASLLIMFVSFITHYSKTNYLTTFYRDVGFVIMYL